jgi:hypothetical protein
MDQILTKKCAPPPLLKRSIVSSLPISYVLVMYEVVDPEPDIPPDSRCYAFGNLEVIQGSKVLSSC